MSEGRIRGPRHLNSVIHKHGRRLLALKNRGCLSLREMASRIGVTRQCIQQILVKLDENYDGRERHQMCSLKSRHEKAVGAFETRKSYRLLRDLRTECEKQGVEFAPIKITGSGGTFRRSRAKVGGFPCAVRDQAWSSKNLNRHTRTENVDGYFRLLTVAGREQRRAVDFVLNFAGRFGWLVIPIEESVTTATYFVLGRELAPVGFYGSVDADRMREGCRHRDWKQYLNRWDLLTGRR